MSCRILFVRHGQSMGNFSKSFLGHTDLDLSPLGYEQSLCTAKYLNDFKIDKIYSSDLLRAHNTAKAYSDISGIEIIEDKGLREIFAGDWEGKSFDDLEKEYPQSYSLIWRCNIGLAHPDGGESVAELCSRVHKKIQQIAEENEGKTIAVFTHATVLRSFFNKINGFEIEDMKDWPWPSNASVSEAKYDNGKFTPVRYGFDDFMNELKSSLPSNV